MKKNLLIKFILFFISAISIETVARGATSQEESGQARRSNGNTSVYYQDGTRFALQGRHQEAIAAFNKALQLNPRNGDAFYSLGNIYSELGRWIEAVGMYRQAIDLNGRDVEAYNGLGVALSKLGKYQESAEAFREAIKIHPNWAEPHWHLSGIYTSLGQPEAARSSYQRAIRLRPDFAKRLPPTAVLVSTAPVQTATVPQPASKTATNVTALTAQSNARPQSVAVGNSASARSVSGTPSVPSKLSTAKDYYKVGIKHDRAQRLNEAVEAFKKSIDLDPNYADAHFSLGQTYAKMGRWKESVEAYEQVVRLNPKDVEAFEMLGKSYAQLRGQAKPNLPSGDSAQAVGEKIGAPPVSTPTLANAATPAGEIKTAANITKGENERRLAVSANAANSEDPRAIYRVGAGDVLDVRLLNTQDKRSTLHTVSSGGLLELPFLSEPVQVTGLTTDEIETRLSKELQRRTADTNMKVKVGVREYASHVVIVSGLVNDPGSKVLRREGVPLYVIVADAQPRPEADRALVISYATGRRTTVDLMDPEAMNMLVRPGDVITVQARPREFFYIAGEVRAPGQQEFHPGLTLTQAILTAGGTTRSAGDVVRLARQGADGRLVMSRYSLKDINSGKVSDPLIQPGDRIEVAP